jgi:hypothetical protein
MQLFEILVYGVIAVAMSMNVIASMRLYRSGYYDAKQKLLQAAIVWGIPIAGSALVMLVMNDEPRRPENTYEPMDFSD